MDPMDRMNAVRAAARSRVVLHEDDNGNLVDDNGKAIKLDEAGNILPADAPRPVVTDPAAPVASVPVVDTPAAPAVVVPPAPTPAEFTAVEEWQATDVNGEPIGPPSKIVGKGLTEAAALRDLAGKLRELNITAARKIKEYRDKYKAYDAEKSVLQFGDPEPLTPETKVQIARLLADPNTIEEGYRLLYKSQFGETPEQVRKRRAQESEANQIREGQNETMKFMREHPDFPAGPAAKQIIIGEMERLREEAIAAGTTFGYTAHNLEVVYDDLCDRGLLIPRQLAPAPAAVVPTVPVPTSGNPAEAAPGQITPATPAQVNTPPSASPASAPASDANTPPAPGSRPRGTKFSTLSTEHGQAPPTQSRQADDAAFRKEVDDMPLETLKRRIKSDRKFAQRLNDFKWQ